MAWRLVEPDAPGLFALITDEGGTHVPTEPDTENLIIGIYDGDDGAELQVLKTDGRAGPCRWYAQNVGHDPDKEPDGPQRIRHLIEDVATHLLLHCVESDEAPEPGLPQS